MRSALLILAVVAAHALFFWGVARQHFLPRTAYVPPRPPPNFAGAVRRTVDPRTGEAQTETQFVVSTALATPPPCPAASPASPAAAK